MADERLEVELSVDTKGAEKINDVSNDIRKLGNDVSSTGSKLSGGTNSIRNFVNSFNSFNNGLNKASRKYNQTFRSFNRTLVNGLKDAGRDIKDFTKDAIDSYTKLSEQHAKTMGVVANSGDYNINTKSGQKKFADDSDRLEKQAIKIAKYGTSGNGSLYDVSKVSEAQAELLKAGVPKKAILNDGVLETVLEFAQANDLDVSKSIGFAQALGNQFNVKYKDWSSMLDKVSHAADLSTIDVSDVVQSMKYAGGITSGLNRNIDEVLGLTAMMGNFGLKGSQSGSAIQALYTRLLTGDTTVITDRQKEVAPTKALRAFYDFSKYAKSDGDKITYGQIKNAKSYDKLGKLGKLSGNLRPMDEVIDKLDEIMSELNDEEQAWFAKKFFGLYQMKGAYALINGDNKSVDKYISEIKNDSKDTNKNKLDQLLNSQYGKTTSLENLWDTTKTEFGGDLSPIVNAVRDQLFNYLKDNGNYEINVQPIRDALNDCSDIIGEKYGESIGNLINNIGNTVIDVADISKELAPEFADGVVNILNKLADGDIFGAFGEWNDMIGKMDDAVDGLPDELRDLGDAITGVIDFFGKFAAFNLGARIVQTLSSAIRAISIAGGAIIKAGSVVVNGGVTGGTGGGSGTSGAGGGTGSSQPQILSRGQKATNAVKFVGGTAGGIAGAYGGEQLGSWAVDQFGGNKTQQGIGGIVGGTIGAAAGYKAGSWATGKAISAGSKLLPALNSAKDSAYLYGLYGLDALSADALVGGTAGSSTAAIAGSLALPAAVVAGSAYMFYDAYSIGKQNQKDVEQIANMSEDEHPLFDKDDNVMRNKDGSLTTINDLIHEKRKTASEYAYDGAYDKEEREYIKQKEPENPVKWYNPFTWGDSDDYELRLEEYNKGQKRIAVRKKEEEKYFYKIQDKLYNDSGIYLTNADFQQDGNSKKLIDWYKSLSTNNPVDFSSLDLGDDADGRNIAKKFSKLTNEWAYAYIDQVYSVLNNAGIKFDINDFKPSDILNGTKKGKGKKTSKQNANVIEENTRNYINKKVGSTGSAGTANTNSDVASIINKSITDRLNNNLVNNAVQVTDNSNINIQPTTTPVTVQPNINISVNVDKDGNSTFTPSQQNTLFDLYTNWSVSKSRSYNTSNKSTKKKG